MGVRKKNRSKIIKEANKKVAFAKLMKCPTSPRKMRLIADQIRGLDINIALNILKTDRKESSGKMEKLLLSCMANWKQKNKDKTIENTDLFIKEVYVDSARMLKRIQPAPQGRAHRIRKRSNHVTMIIDEVKNSDKKIAKIN
tara:strand:+ start:83 stop:508 length:426 start_codon:yes stop_codon:yes gene_type:complete